MATSTALDLHWSVEANSSDGYSTSYTLVGEHLHPDLFEGDGSTAWIKVPITYSDLAEIIEAHRLGDLDLMDATCHAITDAYLAHG